jgi:hypothetical protein
MVRKVWVALLLVQAAWAADTWNREAGEMAAKSPVVQSAKTFLIEEATTISDSRLRAATLDAMQPGTCVAHRAGLTADKKRAILDALVGAGLAERSDRLMNGVFPPLLEEGTACPKLPQAFEAAPGGENGGHHSYPGGLVLHEAFNLRSALNFQRLYGDPLRRDLLVAAPIWHDWAKTLVFQWNPDGTEFVEVAFSGSGAHHILGLAETMKRRLPPDLILTQASAHAAPVLGNEPKVVNWIRAAAIIAGVDPFAEGYLRKDASGQVHVSRILPEFSIHNLSDADFVLSIPAMTIVDDLLKKLAPEFGTYSNGFRNLVLSRLTAERLFLIYSSKGIAGVREEVRKIHPR